MCERYGATRLEGAHCYAVYAGLAEWDALQEEEPGTFYLTDFFVRNFDSFVGRPLGLDRYPELIGDILGNYRRVVYLAQTDDPALRKRAEEVRGLARPRRSNGVGPATAGWRLLSRASSRLPELTVIYWRDIPAQVTATDGPAAVRVALPDRFQEAIDDAAMTAGLVDSDDYLAEWRRETRECGPDLAREVDAEAARLEAKFTEEELERVAGFGGHDEPAPS